MATQTVSSSNAKVVPFPPEQSGVLSILRYEGTPLVRFESARDRHGDAVGFHLFGRTMIIFHDPRAIEDVLVHQHARFKKDEYSQQLTEILGRGLLTSEGDHWKRQRKLAAPSLQPGAIRNYASVMVARSEALVNSWRPGEVRNVHADMMHLTLDILARTLFGHEVSEFQQVEEALEIVMKAFRPLPELLRSLTPAWLPLPSRLQLKRARRQLDSVIYQLIDEKRHAPPGSDLLSRLIAAVDEAGSMSDAELRDEVITLFLAGHETTALVLTFALRLLASHPEARERLVAELDDVCRGRRPTLDDTRNLVFARAVIEETMRLYPPAWTLAREALEDVVVGGWHVPRGTQVILPQWSVHRDPRWFDAPNDFRPERFLPGDGAHVASTHKPVPRYAYFPFGGGPRICIGNHFAMLESVLILATVLQDWTLALLPNDKFGLSPAVTLRPKYPVLMRADRRTTKRSVADDSESAASEALFSQGQSAST